MRILLAILLALTLSASAQAADLVSIATGNFTTASTWALTDTVSKNISTSTSTTTLTTSSLNSASFVLAANQVGGFQFRVGSRTAGTATNTLTATLFNVTTAATACAITINVNDIPATVSGVDNSGWVRAICSAPFTPNGTDSYQLRILLSATTTAVTLGTNGTASNWQRLIIRTTTQAPAAGDDLHISGGFTNAANPATFTAATVTMNETATTQYGAGATNLRTPALTISNGGTLTYSTAVAGNLRISGFIVVHGGGAIALGTSATPIPRTTTAVLEQTPASNNQFQIALKAGTFDAWGESRTSGKNIVHTKLTADASAAATSLTVATDTGWLNGDAITVAAAPTAAVGSEQTQREDVTLTAGAGASTLTVSALTNAHRGGTVRFAEVDLLTRNVRVQTSTAFNSSFQLFGAATLRVQWASINKFGNSTDYAIADDATFTGTVMLNFASVYNMASLGLLFDGGTNSVTDSSLFMIASPGLSGAIVATNNANTATLQRVRMSNNAGGGPALDIRTAAACTNVYDNVQITGTGVTPIWVAGGTQTANCNLTMSDLVIHSMSNAGSGAIYVTGAGIDTLTLTNPVIWHVFDGAVITIEDQTFNGQWTITNPTFISAQYGFGFGLNGVQQVGGSYNAMITVVGGIIANFTDDTRMVAPIEVETANRASANFTFIGTAFGSGATGYANATTSQLLRRTDPSFYGRFVDMKITCDACLTPSSGTDVTGFTEANILSPQSVIAQNTSTKAKASAPGGSVAYEATTCDVAPCLKLTPGSATKKLQTNAGVTGRGFMVALSAGQTPTMSVKIRKDSSYNGNAPRLLVYPVGSSTATVLGTFSAAANTWQTVSGTMGAASTDGIVEVVVDVDGTAGNAYVDSFSASSAQGIDGSLSWFYQGNTVAVAPGTGTGAQLAPTVPADPTTLVATAASASQIGLTWTDVATTEDYYRVERCSGASCSTFAQVGLAAGNATSYTDPGLTASTSYSYRVRAANIVGSSGYSNTSTAVTSAGGVAPAAPTTLVATAASASQIGLTWTDVATTEDYYRIERCSGASCSGFAEIGLAAANATSYTDRGLTAATSYSYRVRATNTAGSSSYSNTGTDTTSAAPPASSGFVTIVFP